MRRRWAAYYFGWLVLVALLANVLANERALVAAYGGRVEFPVFSSRPVLDEQLREADWRLLPPIPYRAGKTELGEKPYLPPLSRGIGGHRHWLGTDRLGRDTAAGLIVGTRTAVLVGLGSLAVALLLGVPLGALGGFYGNDRWRMPLYGMIALLVGVLAGIGYSITSLLYFSDKLGTGVLLSLFAVGACTSGCWLLLRLQGKWIGGLHRRVAIPIDRLVMVLLELTVSVPGLVLLIVALSYITRPSILSIVGIIGLLGWTPVARFLRSELLRIRELPYVAAARVSGVGEWNVLLRHALPNAIGPVVVVAAFLVGGSILTETMLSFLGLGLSADQVTWGSLLRQSRSQPSAWWLAVCPGILLTLTVLACNDLRFTTPTKHEN